MKPFFFIDYDNTIFSHRTWAVPDSALEALSHLKELGCRVVLASGRPFRYTSLPEEFQGRFLPDCLVSSNGAIIETPEEVLWEKYFDPELQTRLLDYVVEKSTVSCPAPTANGVPQTWSVFWNWPVPGSRSSCRSPARPSKRSTTAR